MHVILPAHDTMMDRDWETLFGGCRLLRRTVRVLLASGLQRAGDLRAMIKRVRGLLTLTQVLVVRTENQVIGRIRRGGRFRGGSYFRYGVLKF